MKDKEEPTKTLPDGIWESTPPEKNNDKNKGSLTTDLQGNGYPIRKQNK